VGEAQMATLAHAFACDLTRVATLQWRSSAAVFKVPRPDGSLTAGHHALSHSDYTPQVEADLDLIAQWYAARLKTFLDTLKAMPEGNGSVLDNTLVVWTSEHSGAGDHDRTNIPFLLAGSLGGKFKTGRFLTYNKAPHADLYVAIANAMGLTDMTTFGMAGVSKGPLPNLS
jgi:Protein of unknown function (DUF1552)